MNQFNLKFVFLMLALSSILFFSCSSNQKNESKEEPLTIEEIEILASQDTIRITLNSNDQMQFDKSEINVYEGQTVVLTLFHTGSMPIAAMGHNFVLLTQGTSPSKFAKAALKAKSNAYIPTDGAGVIAHTGLIGGGGRDAITFEAPEKGTYDFICSFPGHYSIMKGKFNVK